MIPRGFSGELPTALEPDLLQGAPLSTCLGGWGQHWSSSLTARNQQSLSQRTTKIDAFLSHDWGTSRWLKFLSLTFIFNANGAVSWTVLVCILFGILTGLKIMPDSDLLLVLLGYAALFFFLFFWQRVRDPFLGSPLVFLDKLCISQTDPVKKEQGILGLGGFLRVSQRLIVLWSPRYFSRLWCTYELVTYLRLNGGMRKVYVMPVKMAVLLLIMSVVWQAVRISNLVWTYTAEDPYWRSVALAGMAFTFLATVPLYNSIGLELFSDIEELPRQLRAFQIQQAACTCCLKGHRHPETGEELACDRQLVFSTLRTWHGPSVEDPNNDDYLERFNELVQTQLSKSLLGSVGGDVLVLSDYIKFTVGCNAPWIARWVSSLMEGPTEDLEGFLWFSWLLREVVDQLMIYLLMFYLMRVSMLLWKAGLPLLERMSRKTLSLVMVIPLTLLTAAAWLPWWLGESLSPGESSVPIMPLMILVLIDAVLFVNFRSRDAQEEASISEYDQSVSEGVQGRFTEEFSEGEETEEPEEATETTAVSDPVQAESSEVGSAFRQYVFVASSAVGCTVLVWGTLDGIVYSDMTEVADASSGAVAADCGYAHVAFRTANGQVFALGANDRGQLGDGAAQASPLPVLVETAAVTGSPVTAIACGYAHTVALTEAGEVMTWGANDVGQLGDASAEDRRIPQRVFQQNDCVGVAAGWHHTACWDCERGEVWVWGSNLCGQVGDGTKECALAPHRVLRQYPLVMHPSRLAVSFLQLMEFQEKVQEESRITYPVMTVREVVHQVVCPATASQPNLGYARLLNSERPLLGEAFISHSWDGPFVAFAEAVVEVFSSWKKPPNLWISFLALSVHTVVPVRLRAAPQEAPWALALQRAKTVLLVRNRRCDVYKRLWCVFELYIASGLGFLSRPGGLLVHGANHPATERTVRISGCETTLPEDKEWLLSYFDLQPGSIEEHQLCQQPLEESFDKKLGDERSPIAFTPKRQAEAKAARPAMPITAAELTSKAAMLNSVEAQDRRAGPDTRLLQAIGHLCLHLECDAAKVATVLGLSLRRLTTAPPRDLEDFAYKVLAGFYSDD
ncbi:RCC1 and BTB domain-containing protein 2 [Symbiodinium microadriaticum]|uniref:RCC1 and BTB domain-containing protein 2 n=1 Tax=Symbiodinium microadriaticum TaxID=2951 RepID=A0A1Q9D6Q4_SYMMI|nr:RCC1 and BTB domain-containing protein 2 [Symbiodinium microadriaticum]